MSDLKVSKPMVTDIFVEGAKNAIINLCKKAKLVDNNYE